MKAGNCMMNACALRLKTHTGTSTSHKWQWKEIQAMTKIETNYKKVAIQNKKNKIIIL